MLVLAQDVQFTSLWSQVQVNVIISCNNDGALRLRILYQPSGALPPNQSLSLLQTLKTAKLMLCPHILVDDATGRRLQRLHDTNGNILGDTATQCRHKDCRTTIDWTKWTSRKGVETMLRVERDIKLLPTDHLLKRPNWLAQVIDPVHHGNIKGDLRIIVSPRPG